MNIALIGISGRVGSRLASELVQRGHRVTGLSRHAAPPAGAASPQTPGLTLRSVDATDADALATALRGHDAVISAARFVSSDAQALIRAVKSAGVPRLLVVGGAGSLEVAPGKLLIDSPSFPDAYKAEAGAGLRFLTVLRDERQLDWTFLSPSALLEPGARAGKFRLGGDQLLADADGKSWISMEDFAIALVDELERPAHSGRRFTVGY